MAEKSEFTKLLEYLRATRGFDFGGYKVSTLMRRVQKRMAEVGVESYADYTDFLEVHPDEFQPLFNTVLINVTSFFRDSPAWEYVAEEIIPRILADRAPDRPVRVWSAGCASGEEAYSIAMLLAEALGEEAFRQRVKIYATDADDEALLQARQGSFEERQMADVPAPLAEKYFERANGRFVFRPELRRALIFGRHDLVQDAAISRVDLLICRNALMYFNGETQAKILARFHFALNRDGYLFLGKAETLLTHGSSFRPVDLKRRVFQRAPNANLRDRLLAISPPAEASDLPPGARQLRLREAAFEHGPVAQLVVDRQGFLVQASHQARRLFGLEPGDLGRLLQDLELSYRPVELRSHLDEAYRSRAQVRVSDVPWQRARGEALHLEIQITPLLEEPDRVLGASLAFLDHTQARQLRQELERTNQELETAYEELQSANEELETTNEELQSTVEELETTNEELQSANEELETMNEELQSTNEELRTMNDQLQQRTVDLNEVNGLLQSILGGLRSAVVVLGHDLAVEVWSPRAEDLWGMRGHEVLRAPFLRLDLGIPVQKLASALQSCRDRGEQAVELEGVNRRGKPILCRITCTPLKGPPGDGKVLLLMEERPVA
jgi:two-component system, chemotaxis family, CheB/CheR fusion protein